MLEHRHARRRGVHARELAREGHRPRDARVLGGDAPHGRREVGRAVAPRVLLHGHGDDGGVRGLWGSVWRGERAVGEVWEHLVGHLDLVVPDEDFLSTSQLKWTYRKVNIPEASMESVHDANPRPVKVMLV